MYPPYVTYHHLAEEEMKTGEPDISIDADLNLHDENLGKAAREIGKEFDHGKIDSYGVTEDRIQNFDISKFKPCTCDVAGDCNCNEEKVTGGDIKKDLGGQIQ